MSEETNNKIETLARKILESGINSDNALLLARGVTAMEKEMMKLPPDEAQHILHTVFFMSRKHQTRESIVEILTIFQEQVFSLLAKKHKS
ncbi:MAG: hypothetical protein HC764_23835 [Pleurocapsa sp. CRU_1_2]|nr:hypothetical protein [Pleurocapsa sp. CRU_1_2]